MVASSFVTVIPFVSFVDASDFESGLARFFLCLITSMAEALLNVWK